MTLPVFILVFVALALVINVIAECENVVFEECRIIHRLDMNAPEIFPDPKSSEPTCGAEGAEGRSCSRCGVSESRSVPATGNHSWNETAPTCTEAGSKTCKVCGKTESGSAALGHDWVHHDEEGHSVCVCTCYCGEVFYSYDEWHAHARASYDDDYLNAHAGYWCYFDWVVDVPAYDVCSRCGMTK